MRTPFQTAILIALLFKRSEKSRARISKLTIKNLSKRKLLRSVFIEMLTDELDSLGIIFIELERDGFGLISASALNGAPAITAKKFLIDDLKKLRRKEINFDDILNELDGSEDSDEDEDY
ncbi:MAG: hypothetical protein Q8Q54_16230 [Methylococcales bacterium]|nr:hypothetical protein [Methylococcales bacterium]MDP3840466.1 hypothetical protein [Methylococcales bacterium]